ncbi:unnamed protein product, partial [Didymodactylos carnosus]
DIEVNFKNFDKEQYYVKLKDKARGCVEKCPCCKRPCDADHSSIKANAGGEDNKHHCQTGHQLRAMAGFKFEISNEASLIQCEQMTDEKFIVVKGTRKKWTEFKKDYPDWDFNKSISQDKNELQRLRSKFLHVWGKIGQRLCGKYDMVYVKQNTEPILPKPTHYILLLDGSGSMGINNAWTHLLQGVKEFIKIRIDSGTTDRITIIVFDDKATYAFFNEDLKNVDLSNMNFPRGRTDFENAFQAVVNTIENLKNEKTPLDYMIIFMSDGQAPYPAKQLETLLTMKDRINQFWTVALGKAEIQVLEDINKKMDGTFKDIKDSVDLVQAYAEIAHN